MPDETADVTVALRLARRRNGSGPPDLNDRIEELSELLWALHPIGDRQLLDRVADRLVLATADIDQDDDSWAWTLALIVQALATVGQVGRAERVIATIDHEWTRSEAQHLLAGAQAVAGDFRGAEQTLDLITAPEERNQGLIELVSALDGAGDHAGALRVAYRAEECIATIQDVGNHLDNLVGLVRALNNGGHPVDAWRIADRAGARAGPVRALARTGQLDKAVKLILRITDQIHRKEDVLNDRP